ncbi:IS3-Spn1 transposase [Streptococcus pneumoniae]|nr:IS3-Spn1 transposase [Streptococcus pneumoniae]
MKLSYDDKVQIYELRKQGYSLEKLSNKFGINNSPFLQGVPAVYLQIFFRKPEIIIPKYLIL